jgi:predicted TIM-barrel fold metal-dependent hydrolase
MCRAYNRWLADYGKLYPDRLFGVAMLPMQPVELAIEDVRYAREKLGMRGGFPKISGGDEASWAQRHFYLWPDRHLPRTDPQRR